MYVRREISYITFFLLLIYCFGTFAIAINFCSSTQSSLTLSYIHTTSCYGYTSFSYGFATKLYLLPLLSSFFAQVKGYRTLKSDLRQTLADMEHERKMAHMEPSPRMSKADLYQTTQNDFPRPNNPVFAAGGGNKMRYKQSPIFKLGIYPYTMPRSG